MVDWVTIDDEHHSWRANIAGRMICDYIPKVCSNLSDTIVKYQLSGTDAFEKYTHKESVREFQFHGLKADILCRVATVDQNGAQQVSRKGYLSILKPLHDKYTHAGFLGTWQSAEKTYWLEKWMGEDGEREIGEGQLFKHVYSEEPGTVLLVKWAEDQQGSTIVHPENREHIKMDDGDVFVIPVRNGRECLALMVQAWPGSIKYGKPTGGAIQDAAFLYALGHVVLAPLLVGRAMLASDDDLMGSVVRALGPPARVTYHTLSHSAETLQALRNDRSVPSRTRDEVGRLIADLFQEARRVLGHVNALEPVKEPFGAPRVTARELPEIVHAAYRRMVQAEANRGYPWSTVKDWLSLELPSMKWGDGRTEEGKKKLSAWLVIWKQWKERTSKDEENAKENENEALIPLPRFVLEEILRELLSNAYHSICERAELPEEKRPSACINECIDVALKFIDNTIELAIMDNGVGFSLHGKARARRFGFTGRAGGSGWGLAVVRRQMEAIGGGIRLEGEKNSRQPGTGTATLVFPKEENKEAAGKA